MALFIIHLSKDTTTSKTSNSLSLSAPFPQLSSFLLCSFLLFLLYFVSPTTFASSHSVGFNPPHPPPPPPPPHTHMRARTHNPFLQACNSPSLPPSLCFSRSSPSHPFSLPYLCPCLTPSPFTIHHMWWMVKGRQCNKCDRAPYSFLNFVATRTKVRGSVLPLWLIEVVLCP